MQNAVFESLFAVVKRSPLLLPRALDVMSGLTDVSKEACAAFVERGGVELLCAELRAIGFRDDVFTGLHFTRCSIASYLGDRNGRKRCALLNAQATSSVRRKKRTSCSPTTCRCCSAS